MKRIAPLSVALVACLLLGAHLISEKQAEIGSILGKFKLKPVPSKLIGGPQQYKVTQATLDHLEKMMDDEVVFVVNAKGEVTTESLKEDETE